jgi:hypothetical protein
MPAQTKPATIDREAIARRAHERYEARGRTHGHDIGDWHAAEAELRAEAQHDRTRRPSHKPAPAPKPATNGRAKRGKGKG